MSPKFSHRHSLTAVAGLLLVGAFTALGACSASSEPVDSEDLVAAPESSEYGITSEVASGTTLRSTANVNLRTQASTSASVIRVIPSGSTVTVVDSIPKNGFYKINHNGTVGWSYGQYYEIVSDGGVDGSVPAGSKMTTTGDLNLRSGPDTTYDIVTVIPTGSQVTVVDPTPKNGWYNISFSGSTGWSSGKYLDTGSGGGSTGGGSSSVRDSAIARAKSAVGFSYWWGHGRFRPEGVTSSIAGSCSGSCPNCSHSGSWGGDCSGLVAKVWQVPSSNTDLTADSHPYSTATFVTDSSQWKTVSRGNVLKGDALVYNQNGAGHIFIYNSGDAWGSMYAYECRGCSAGCTYGSRTAGSTYHAIRKVGW